MPANWHWLVLGLAALVAGVIWGLVGGEPESPLGPEDGLRATRDAGDERRGGNA